MRDVQWLDLVWEVWFRLVVDEREAMTPTRPGLHEKKERERVRERSSYIDRQTDRHTHARTHAHTHAHTHREREHK